jgi:hypothetical protein
VNGQLHAPAAFSPGKEIPIPIDMKLAGRCAEKEKETLPRQESNPGRPARRLVTMLTELPQLFT